VTSTPDGPTARRTQAHELWESETDEQRAPNRNSLLHHVPWSPPTQVKKIDLAESDSSARSHIKANLKKRLVFVVGSFGCWSLRTRFLRFFVFFSLVVSKGRKPWYHPPIQKNSVNLSSCV